MYNEERKLKYIEEKKNGNNQLEANSTRLFNRIEQEEISKGKDLCEFSLKEIIEVYKQNGTASLETLMMVNSYYRMYSDWCLTKGYISDGQNHYAELNYDLLNSECVNIWIKDKQIFTRSELISLCSKLPNYGDRFILLGLFEGICGVKCKEIANVSMSSITDKNKITTITGRQVPISNQLLYYLQEACRQYEYIPYGTQGVRPQYYYDKSDDRAVKRMYNGNTDETESSWRIRVGARLRRVNEKFDIDVGTKSLLCSGIIEYVNNRKEEKLTPYEFIMENKEEIESRWINIASVKRFCLKYNDFFK